MYTKIYAQFDSIEFAELAAKMIKENVNGQKKITIHRDRNNFTGSISGRTELAAVNGNGHILYPFSTHSNNYVTNFVIKDIIKDEVNELLHSKSVTMEVVCESSVISDAKQYILSYGGYSIRN